MWDLFTKLASLGGLQSFYMAHKNQGGGVLLDTSHEINYLQRLFGNITNVQGILENFQI